MRRWREHHSTIVDHERSESPARGENLVESDGLEQHKNSLAGFLGRVSTKLKCAKACLVELKYDELESALKDLFSLEEIR